MKNNTTARRIWTKPEISVARVSDAQVGNNSETIDQGYPAMNGSTAHFS